MKKSNAIYLDRGKIKTWLKMKQWGHRDLARAVHCNEGLVSRWLRERLPECPSDIYKERICAVTGLNLGDIFLLDRGKIKPWQGQ